ncbi:MAG: nucleoside/nucleotide kinase family protein [Alphaproteobacteria bacterium]
MPEYTDMDALIAKIYRMEGGRILVAIAGPPGVGKSTFVEELRRQLNQRADGVCEILPMDGYHYDDVYLEQQNIRHRKGAPFTFDVGGLRAMLSRLETNDEAEISVPVFDREIEIARAGARMVDQSVKYILVEGNYLLLNTGLWPGLRKYFNLTVMLHAPEDTLKMRLIERWTGFGFALEQAKEKAASNDLLNVKEVLENSVLADHLINTEGG